ncbi:hypothetical protein WA158_005961 [Blastocystis sp. Blastoise]
MSENKSILTEEKYLFTFQDETQLWIQKEFIEKYPQFPFYDIIKHTDKYDDGSYYVDMPSLSMNKVIDFLMDKSMDIDSLNLEDSYDIYKTLIEYSITIDKKIQRNLLFHVKELFYKYLIDNNYDVYGYYCKNIKSRLPIELFTSDRIIIVIKGLLTPQRKDELLYYSLLFKMMNVTKVKITYDYSSSIPLEYICPSCIQDIFSSLEKLIISVVTHYQKSDELLNPNSDKYIMEYIRLFNEYDSIDDLEKYEYYTESDMNEYNKTSSLDLNKIYYSNKFINSYNKKRQKNKLPKLYKYIINEAIYTNNYSKVEMNETEDEYILDDQIIIEYDDKTNNKAFTIDDVSCKLGISQLLCLASYLSISKIILNTYYISKYNSVIFMKLFEEGVFDSSTALSVYAIKEITKNIDENLLSRIITTHVFPNVTELIYDIEDNYEDDNNYNDNNDNNNNNDSINIELFELFSLTKVCFPKLHIIDYKIDINFENFDSLFLVNLISMIDTIRIWKIFIGQRDIFRRLDDLSYTHSIHIDIIDMDIASSPHSENIKILNYIEKKKHNINSLEILFKDDRSNEIDMRNSLEKFLKSNVLQHLNDLIIILYENRSIEYLAWISTLFNDNKFNNIHKLEVDFCYVNYEFSSEYSNVYENILEKLIPKASIIVIKGCYMSFINRLICKGCFHHTTQLIIDTEDIPDGNICKLFTIDNFPQIKSIEFFQEYYNGWWRSFIKTFHKYINNSNFLSFRTIRLSCGISTIDIFVPNNSILRYIYDSNSCVNTIIGTKVIYNL